MVSIWVAIIGPVRRAVSYLIQPSRLVRGQDGRFGPSKKFSADRKVSDARIVKVQRMIQAERKGKEKQSRLNPTRPSVYQSWLSLYNPCSLIHNTSPCCAQSCLISPNVKTPVYVVYPISVTCRCSKSMKHRKSKIWPWPSVV